MRIQASTAVLSSLGCGALLSLSQNVDLVNATVDRTEAIYHANAQEYQQYLNKKLRAKIAHRRMSRSGGDKSIPETEFCTPLSLKPYFEMPTSKVDLGILTSSCPNPGHTCMPDPLSSLGGRCTSDENGLIGLENIGSKTDLSSMKMGEKLKAKWSLDQSTVGSSSFGKECKLPNPSSELKYYDSVDVGVLHECSNSEHVCVEDVLSPTGGVCAGSFTLKEDMEKGANRLVRGHRRLLECDYRNGTSGGTKCSGSHACYGLSPAFIMNNIGCGSCNEYGACQYLTAFSSIGENSCNGVNSCSYFNWANVTTPTILSVADESCNDYYACSYALGNTEIENYSCIGVYSCSGLLGTSKIAAESCNKDGACQYLLGYTNIDSQSCYGCYACKGSSGVTTVRRNSCNGLERAPIRMVQRHLEACVLLLQTVN